MKDTNVIAIVGSVLTPLGFLTSFLLSAIWKNLEATREEINRLKTRVALLERDCSCYGNKSRT